MITIVKPHSVYADRTDANEFELQWSTTVSGQYAYEIYYKFNNAATWSTTGIINSTSTTYDLREIYNLVEVDFSEILYKVKLYYNTTNNEGQLTGTEESDIYTIIFSQPVSAYFKVYDGEEIEDYPLFSSIENSNCNTFNIQTDNGKLLTPLVDDESSIASNLKIKVGNNNLALVKESATDLAYTQNRHGDFEQQGTGYYYYSYNKQDSNTYYYYTNPKDKYYYYYSYVKSTYNYNYTQKQSSATTTTKSDKYYYFYKNDKYYVYSTTKYYAYKYMYYYSKHYSYTKTYSYASTPAYYYITTYNTYPVSTYWIYTYNGTIYASTPIYGPSDTYYYYKYYSKQYYYANYHSKTYKYTSTSTYTTYVYNNSTTYKYNTSTYNYYYNYSNTTTTYYYKSNPSNTYYYYKNNYGGYYYYYVNTQTMYSQLYSYNYQT